MDNFPFLGIISIFLVFLCTLLVIFLTTISAKNKLSNRLLACYFLIYSVHISVFFYTNYIELPSVLERLRDQIMFLSSPILYLYLLSSIYADFKLRRKHLWHLMPFLMDLSIFMPRFYLLGDEKRRWFLANYNTTQEAQLSALLAALVILFYLALMFRELMKYKKALNERYANKANFNFRWLVQLTVLLSILFVVSQIKQVYFFFGTDVAVLGILRILLNTAVFIFLTWIVLKSLYYPNLFRNINSKHLLFSKEGTLNHHPSLSASALEAFMKSEKPFLDAMLSLNDLAEKMNMPSRELSMVINQNFRNHFHDYINEYRIEEVKRLLGTKAGQRMTIQEIMYNSGFNSKSSFYTEFKKRLHQTPTQYKEKMQ